MPEQGLEVLVGLAVTIAFSHTLIGVDHYVPFVALAKAQKWGVRRLLSVTALCGLGHVVGSVALGFVGIGLGYAISGLEWIEGIRGDLAGWETSGHSEGRREPKSRRGGR